MTVILICPKEYEIKLCGRKLSDFALEKIKDLGGAIICVSDSGEAVRRAFEKAVSTPVLIYPTNFLTAAPVTPAVKACRKGYDMAVISSAYGGRGEIFALNRLPEGFIDTDNLRTAAAAEGFNIKRILTEDFCTEINGRESYLAAQKAIMNGEYVPEVPFKDTDFLPGSAKTRGAKCSFPAYIGKNCVIGENVRIAEGTSIGDNVYIGANSELIGSAVMDGAYVSGGCILKNSIVSENAAVSHGKKAENSILTGRFGESPSYSEKPPAFGSDGIMARVLSPSEAFTLGQAFALKNTAFACSEENFPAAEGFSAGVIAAGGNVTDFGAVPENVFRFALKSSMCGCGIYFGSDYLRIWDGDGFPSDESQRRLAEDAIHHPGKDFKAQTSQTGGIIKAGNIYDSYNNYLDKLIVSDISGIFADVTIPDKELYAICRSFTERHGADCRDNPRIAFHISSDGGRISAYTDETGYVFHDRLAMLCMMRSSSPYVSVGSGFPHVQLRRAKGEGVINLKRFDYAPDRAAMTSEEAKADKAVRTAAKLKYFDGAAIMAMILNILSEEKLTLEKAVSALPSYSSSSRMIPLKSSTEEILRRIGLSPRGGMLPAERGKAYIRPLRTGGVILSAESASLEISSEICGFYEELLHSKDR